MTSFEERTLGVAAIDYVRRRLTDGKALSRHLLASRDLNSGSVVSFVPADADSDEIHEFDVGHARQSAGDASVFTSESGAAWRMIRTPNADANLAEAIAAFFREATDALCIFEHGLARRADPFLENATFSVAFCGDEVYPFAAAGDDLARIADTIRGATTAYPPLVAALTRGELSTQRVELAEADLASLAAKTDEIIVGAYDGEGYVIWRSAE